MINFKEKTEKKEQAAKGNSAHPEVAFVKEYFFDGVKMTYNPDLDKFSGNEFLPEKHKEDERRLKKSKLPDSFSSFK